MKMTGQKPLLAKTKITNYKDVSQLRWRNKGSYSLNLKILTTAGHKDLYCLSLILKMTAVNHNLIDVAKAYVIVTGRPISKDSN